MNKKRIVIIGALLVIGLLVVMALSLRGGQVRTVTVSSSGTISPIQKRDTTQTSAPVPTVQKGEGSATINGEDIGVGGGVVSPPEAPPIPIGTTPQEMPLDPPSLKLLMPPTQQKTPSTSPPSTTPQLSPEDAIRSFSVFDASPELKLFREQMVKEDVIKADEFVKINNNADMEQFLIKLITWKGKSMGATDEQIQNSLAGIVKGYAALRSGY